MDGRGGVKGVALLILAFLLGCHPRPALDLPAISHVDTRRIAVVVIDTAVARFAIRTYAVADSLKLEDIVCLYGTIETPDSLAVLRIDRAAAPDTVFSRGAHWIGALCPKGEGYVGRFHTHLSHGGMAPMPHPSPIDELSFFNDTQALIMFIGIGHLALGTDTLLAVAYEFQDRRRGHIMLRAH